MKITYRQITSQIDNGLFHTATQMPLTSETAIAVYKQYCKLCGVYARENLATYYGYTHGVDMYFIHPNLCPPRLLKLARRHLSAHFIKTRGPNSVNMKETMYTAFNFARRRAVIDDPLKRGTPEKKARLIELRPHRKGLYAYDRALGIEIEGTAPMDRGQLTDALPYYTQAVSDNSIRVVNENHEPHEIRMLLNRATFDPRLHRVCNALSAAGFRTNKTCGLHVHMDARHLQMIARKKIQKSMTAWLKLLIELVPESRRNNTYCKLDLASGRYCAVSVETGGKNTIEVRLHSSTIDQNKITMWIRLIELLAVLPAPARKLTTTLVGLESLPLCEWDKTYWRSRHRQLNPGQYPVTPASTDASE
jgi:hypothetical protein